MTGTATLSLDRETQVGTLTAVCNTLELLTPVLENGGQIAPDAARRTAAELYRAAEAMTALADSAEALPDNVVDFAAFYRARRDRIRTGAP